MKRLLPLLLVVLLLLFCACSSSIEGVCNSSAVNESSQDERLTNDMVVISTPYADLRLSKSIADNVFYDITHTSPYTLSFKAKRDGTELFSFVFNGDGDSIVGTIVGENNNTVVYLNTAKLDADSENYNEYLSYQMGINDITNALTELDNFVFGEVVEWEDAGNFEIKTSVVTLKYPNKWKNKVDIVISEDVVKFSYYNVNLFDIYFKEVENGSLIGLYENTPIYVVSYSPDNDLLNEKQMDEYTSMQYGINVIIKCLKEYKNFSTE